MYILLSITLFLLGGSLTAVLFCIRERNVAEIARDNTEQFAQQKNREAMYAVQNASYYQREAQYWKGVVFGDKAQAIYNAALNSIQDGSGFAIQTKPSSNNVVPFPTRQVNEKE